MEIKVLGTGCKNCKKLYEIVDNYVINKQITASVTYVTDYAEIMNYGIMSVPALVIDNKVITTGKMLSEKDLDSIIKGDNNSPCGTSCNCGINNK